VRIADSEPEEAEVICLIIARLGLKDTNKRLLFHTDRLVDFLLGLLGGSSELGQQVWLHGPAGHSGNAARRTGGVPLDRRGSSIRRLTERAGCGHTREGGRQAADRVMRYSVPADVAS
jgi:hypothetical protein